MTPGIPLRPGRPGEEEVEKDGGRVKGGGKIQDEGLSRKKTGYWWNSKLEKDESPATSKSLGSFVSIVTRVTGETLEAWTSTEAGLTSFS